MTSPKSATLDPNLRKALLHLPDGGELRGVAKADVFKLYRDQDMVNKAEAARPPAEQ
jgi:hypothetical protein